MKIQTTKNDTTEKPHNVVEVFVKNLTLKIFENNKFASRGLLTNCQTPMNYYLFSHYISKIASKTHVLNETIG